MSNQFDNHTHCFPGGVYIPIPIWTNDRREAMLIELAKWRSAAHRNRACIPYSAIDCVHLIREGLVAAMLIPRIPLRFYEAQLGAFEESDHVERIILATLHAVTVSPDFPVFGDLPIFKTGTFSGHAGIYDDAGGGQIWHSLHNQGVVVTPYEVYRREIKTLIRITAPGINSLQ